MPTLDARADSVVIACEPLARVAALGWRDAHLQSSHAPSVTPL